MSIPYSRTFEELTVTAGTPEVFELRYPYRGVLTQWGLKRTGGSGGTATTACIISLYPDAVSAAAHDVTRRLLHKTEELPWGENVEQPFLNREGTPSNPVRKLYLRIETTNGVGDQDFTFELSSLQPDPI